MSKSNIISEFSNPSVAFRGKPFWAWNGKLEKEELIRQIHVMKQMGFGGYFMHSRTGLETEYLGNEWFELINACADEGKKLDMQSWLYDEDRWPSGTAGGLVTENPEYRMKFLNLTIVDKIEFSCVENYVVAYSAEVEGVDLKNYSKIEDVTSEKDYPFNKVLVFKIKEMEKDTFYNGNTYVDTLNKDAINYYIKSTHEIYKQKCGDKLGTSIQGIFTDEPHRGQLMSTFGSSNTQSQMQKWSVPWTYKIFDEFENRFGYDLLERLPELFLIYKGEKVSEVKWNYVELLQELFLECFAKPYNEWCKRNKMIFTGHILHEDNLTAQTAVSGSVMRFYEHMEYPGIDILTECNKNYWVVKQVASVARQLGKKWILSELYGCTGWQFSFESHKNVGDWQALLGVNLRCHHLSWYTMKGEAKRDYPASILHQSTWWKDYKYVEDYFSRFNVAMSEGNPVCNTLVINPVESVWSQVYPGWCDSLMPVDDNIVEAENKYTQTFMWLTGAHIDFDYGDEEMISRLYKIEKKNKLDVVLRIGQARYKQVVISGMTTIRSTTIDILNKFVEAGGKVIFAGETPEYVNAIKSNVINDLINKCCRVEFEKSNFINAVNDSASKIVEIKDESSNDVEDIMVQVKQNNSDFYIMMLNLDRNKSIENVNINIKGNGYIEKWKCSTGERYALGQTNNGEFDLITSFSAGEEMLLILTKEQTTSVKENNKKDLINSINHNKSYEFELDEPNICVLDRASFQINDQQWENTDEILKVDRKIREALGLANRSGSMLQPWFVEKNGYDIKANIGLCYEFNIEEIPDSPVFLVVEEPEKYEILVNNSKIDNHNYNDWWIDICMKKLILSPDVLKKGSNKITLKTSFHERSDIEAIYIIGNFGVKLDSKEKVITDLPKTINCGDIKEQGLPFYSGRLTYKTNIDYKPKEGEQVKLKLNKLSNAACVKVVGEDNKVNMIAWQPYEADITEALRVGSKLNIEYVLTRRNTFGPLHLKPALALGYGPDSFTTIGENYSEEYMLIESGMLKEPKIKVYK